MIEYNDKEMGIIRDIFPNLYYDQKFNRIKGEINITAHYVQNDKGKWLIKKCESSDVECITESYNIKISLNEEPPKVFELEKRIECLYYENKHLFTDGSCCLGIFKSNPNESLSDFVIKKVYPYFVWHAYFEKYGEKPPCGEYSHAKGHEEFLECFKNMGRNSLCLCGSGKKYKKCCIDNPSVKSFIEELKTRKPLDNEVPSGEYEEFLEDYTKSPENS